MAKNWGSSFRTLSAAFVAATAISCTSEEPGGSPSTPEGGVVMGSGGSTSAGGANGSNGGARANGGTNNSNGGTNNSNGGTQVNGGASGSSAGGATTGSGGSNGNGGAASGTGGAVGGDGGPCFHATRLWFEDWETGDYGRWTSNTYGADWGNDCQANGISTEQAVSGTHSNKSVITCPYTAMGNVHRGYGGLQFSGDTVVPAYTNQGVGIDAPHGVVNTYWSYLQTSTVFQNGTWFSFWTVNDSCDWSNDVMTLGLEDPSNALAAAHYQANAGGTRTYLNGPPGFPLGRWVRTTIYINYYDQVMHVWQDGVEESHVTFDRTQNTICQWHWGAYASGDNDDITLYEDDNSIWKLGEAWSDLSVEPYFGRTIAVCP
jgi:hypothetical protein